MRKALGITSAICLLSAAATAQDGLQLLPECKPTPLRPAGPGYPGEGKVIKSSNLRLKTGAAVPAAGKPVTIVGRVLDGACVPLQDAVVEIWQADSAGAPSGQSKDPHFAGSGRAVTNNLGEFRFVTVEPGGKRPVIHFRVSHQAFPVLTTELYVDAQAVEQDAELKKLTIGERNLLTPLGMKALSDGSAVTFDITLKGRAKYRGY
ncbi:MAG: hypothetical protein J0L97_11205 [Alphaproteobacteria bacterium]|nr:hypothetical protein [Alphaproteobacteria bacterium]